MLSGSEVSLWNFLEGCVSLDATGPQSSEERMSSWCVLFLDEGYQAQYQVPTGAQKKSGFHCKGDLKIKYKHILD